MPQVIEERQFATGIYPTPEQEHIMLITLEAAKFVYDWTVTRRGTMTWRALNRLYSAEKRKNDWFPEASSAAMSTAYNHALYGHRWHDSYFVRNVRPGNSCLWLPNNHRNKVGWIRCEKSLPYVLDKARIIRNDDGWVIAGVYEMVVTVRS